MRYLVDRLEELTRSEAEVIFLCLIAEINGRSVRNRPMRSDLRLLSTSLLATSTGDQTILLCLLAARHKTLTYQFRIAKNSALPVSRTIQAAAARIKTGEEWPTLAELAPTELRSVQSLIV